MQSVPAFVPEALIASKVGTWHTSRDGEHVVTDAATAALFGVDVEAAALGLPLATFVRALHPADREAFHEKHARAVVHGGLFVIEYRTMPRADGLCWVLARGRYERDPVTGEMQGRGICLDITDSKPNGHVEDRAFSLELDVMPHEAPLDRVAALAIEARHIIDAMGDEGQPVLRHAVDGLLWAAGRALARQALDPE